jgi:transposase-like protein
MTQTKSKTLDPETRQEIINRAINGENRKELAEEYGIESKRVHNMVGNYLRDMKKAGKSTQKGLKTAPAKQHIKIQKLEIEKEETKAKTMVIITSDIDMLKKLIGEL